MSRRNAPFPAHLPHDQGQRGTRRVLRRGCEPAAAGDVNAGYRLAKKAVVHQAPSPEHKNCARA